MTDISRLASGERWDGDNAEVLRARGWTVLPGGVCKDPDGWAHADMPQPLDRVDDALALKDPSDRLSLVEGDDGWHAHLSRSSPAGWRLFEGDAPTHAVALCIAILRTGESHD